MNTVQVPKSLLSIQMLRAVAAISVVIYHAQVMLHHTAGYVYQDHNTGAAGVDIFFVISGFIMYFTNWGEFERTGAATRFLIHRMVRIVPVYWIYTTLITALLFFWPTLFQEMKFGLPEAIGSYLFLLFVNTNGQIGPNIGVGWTLSFEMYFYILFSVFLFFPRRLLLWGLGTIFMAGVIARLFLSHISPAVELFTSTLLLEFFGGCCIGWFVRHGYYPSRWIAVTLCILGISAILATGQTNMLGDRFQPNRILLFGVPAAFIVYGAVTLEVKKLLRTPFFLVALGNSSYSIYLVQVFTLPLVGKGWKALGLTAHIGPWAAYITGIVVTLGAGHTLYVLIERPITRLLRRRAEPKNTARILRAPT